MTTWLERIAAPEGPFPRRRKYGRRGRLVEISSADKTAVEWRRILSADPCCYCGERKPIEVDHITAVARGGGHDWENLTAACHDCNGSKLAAPWWRLLMRRRRRSVPRRADRPQDIRRNVGGQSRDGLALAGARHAREEQSRVKDCVCVVVDRRRTHAFTNGVGR